MAPFTTFLAAASAFVSNNNNNPASAPLLSSSSDEGPGTPQRASSARAEGGDSDDCSMSSLCAQFGAEPTDLLSLRTNDVGVRGVFLNGAVEENDVILSMPLEACLRDDEPPAWLAQHSSNDEDDSSDAYSVSVEGWVTRLAAGLLDVRHNRDDKSEAIGAWLDLLPTDLREALPIHWDEADVARAGSRALEAAVDSACFARAGPISDIMESLRDNDVDDPGLADITQRQVEDALDLVQTRSCRAESSDGSPYIRVLAPIFDMINHNREHNAEFFREGDFVVVRARRAIGKDEELFINYGDSTRPAWRCLFSYGFVPVSENIYEDDAAEVILDNNMGIVEVGPTEIPYELVQYEAEELGLDSGEDMEFTPEIGQNIVDRVTTTAKRLEANIEKGSGSSEYASQSINNLRESNRRTLWPALEVFENTWRRCDLVTLIGRNLGQ